jgi:hypothetical protein
MARYISWAMVAPMESLPQLPCGRYVARGAQQRVQSLLDGLASRDIVRSAIGRELLLHARSKANRKDKGPFVRHCAYSVTQPCNGSA